METHRIPLLADELALLPLHPACNNSPPNHNTTVPFISRTELNRAPPLPQADESRPQRPPLHNIISSDWQRELQRARGGAVGDRCGSSRHCRALPSSAQPPANEGEKNST